MEEEIKVSEEEIDERDRYIVTVAALRGDYYYSGYKVRMVVFVGTCLECWDYANVNEDTDFLPMVDKCSNVKNFWLWNMDLDLYVGEYTYILVNQTGLGVGDIAGVEYVWLMGDEMASSTLEFNVVDVGCYAVLCESDERRHGGEYDTGVVHVGKKDECERVLRSQWFAEQNCIDWPSNSFMVGDPNHTLREGDTMTVAEGRRLTELSSRWQDVDGVIRKRVCVARDDEQTCLL